MPYECDWRDADACAYLHDLGATAFAWEFLRRNSAYQAAYQSIAGAGHAVAEMSERVAHQWGCDFAADPSLSADRASVVWLPHINPTTVVLGPAPDESVEARSISEVTLPLSRLTANGEHWLLDRGCDALPIALIGGMDTARRVAVVIPLDDSFPVRAEAAGRLFNALTARTPARAPSALTEQQRRRLGLVLRGLDGWLERCSYRQIAKVLFGPNSVPAGRGWKTHELRGRTVRLCSRGRDLMHGAYLNLLRHPGEVRS